MKNIKRNFKFLPPSVLPLFLGILTFLSCQKTIDIKPLPYDSKVSIQCLITPDSLPKLYLSKSVPFFDYKILPKDVFIPDAVVKIISEKGEIDVLKPDSSFNYYYCRSEYFYKGSIKIKINTAYSMEVVTNGQTFKATTSTVLPQVKIESVSYVKNFQDVYGGHEGVVVTVRDVAGQANFYRYQLTRQIDSTIEAANNPSKSTCLGKESAWITEIGRTAYDDTGLDGSLIKMTMEPVFSHKKGTMGVIRIQTLDANSAAFFNNLDNQKVSVFNPFVEPVLLKTAIEGCIGIFGAYVLSEPFVFVYPE